MNSANSAALDDDGDKENNRDTSVCASREADQGLSKYTPPPPARCLDPYESLSY